MRFPNSESSFVQPGEKSKKYVNRTTGPFCRDSDRVTDSLPRTGRVKSGAVSPTESAMAPVFVPQVGATASLTRPRHGSTLGTTSHGDPGQRGGGSEDDRVPAPRGSPQGLLA